MKCPKCDYLGFETGDRCRNCGYDFSLLASPSAEPPPELALKPPPSEDAAPIGDLWLVSSDSEPRSSAGTDNRSTPLEFPLFSPSDDDEPLIKKPSAPRAPLSVRRTPDSSRARSASRTPRAIEGGLTLEFADEGPVAGAAPVKNSTIVSMPVAAARPQAATGLASFGNRTIAALIDHAILFGIDVIVFYSTLRMTALTTDEWRALPLLPFVAFLLLLKLTYFSAFTAIGGQTIGKMAAGIRVVADDHLTMDPARAITRTLTGVVSLGSLGLGFVPALISPDRRALHDRVAHTRVVDLPSA
jgi:uncharacterized RDD family membrane protein YckC